MKKIFLFVFLLSFSIAGKAQFKGGFYVGINGSQVDGDRDAGYHKLGLNIGPTVMYPVSKRFDIAMEILYSQKGSQSKTIEGYPRQLFFKLDYVEIPLLLNFHGPPNVSEKDKNKKLDKVTLTMGASIARLVKDTLDQYVIPGYLTNSIDQSTLVFRTADYSFIFGGAYQLTDHFQINIRYSYSIAQFGSTASSRSRNNGLFNNVVTFRIGYIIQGKAK